MAKRTPTVKQLDANQSQLGKLGEPWTHNFNTSGGLLTEEIQCCDSVFSKNLVNS